MFEAFEVLPPAAEVMGKEGKLLCSYPGPAIEIPLGTSQDFEFAKNFVSFIISMDINRMDATPTAADIAPPAVQSRSANNPKYITQLLIAILHGMGREANVQRITKRISDEVCCTSTLKPWRRSPFYLVLRIVVQRMSESRDIYKQWMLFFRTRLL